MTYATKYQGVNPEGDFPIYPGADIQSVELGEHYFVRITTFESRDKPESIFMFYKGALEKSGWKMRNETQGSISFIYEFSDGTSYTLRIESRRISSTRYSYQLYSILNPSR